MRQSQLGCPRPVGARNRPAMEQHSLLAASWERYSSLRMRGPGVQLPESHVAGDVADDGAAVVAMVLEVSRALEKVFVAQKLLVHKRVVGSVAAVAVAFEGPCGCGYC